MDVWFCWRFSITLPQNPSYSPPISARVVWAWICCCGRCPFVHSTTMYAQLPGLTLFLCCWLIIIFQGLEWASLEWRKLHSHVLICPWPDIRCEVVHCCVEGWFVSSLGACEVYITLFGLSVPNGQKINQYGSLGIQEDSNVTDEGDCSGLLLWRRDVMPLFPVELHAAGTCAYILITYDEVNWQQCLQLNYFPWQN